MNAVEFFARANGINKEALRIILADINAINERLNDVRLRESQRLNDILRKQNETLTSWIKKIKIADYSKAAIQKK